MGVGYRPLATYNLALLLDMAIVSIEYLAPTRTYVVCNTSAFKHNLSQKHRLVVNLFPVAT